MFTTAPSIIALDDVEAAEAYQAMSHNPYRYDVVRSYLSFEHETLEQWRQLKELGIRFTFHHGSHEYANSKAMLADLSTGHLWVRLSDADGLPSDHPMARATNYSGLTLNDIFRAVHDVNGHGVASDRGLVASFGPVGERNAWLTHRAQYSEGAHAALWCETRGQASWTNAYGDHADLELKDRPFADQKAGMPPTKFL